MALHTKNDKFTVSALKIKLLLSVLYETLGGIVYGHAISNKVNNRPICVIHLWLLIFIKIARLVSAILTCVVLVYRR